MLSDTNVTAQIYFKIFKLKKCCCFFIRCESTNFSKIYQRLVDIVFDIFVGLIYPSRASRLHIKVTGKHLDIDSSLKV